MAFLGAGLLVFLYLRPPTLEQVALRGLEAIERRDARLLLHQLTRREVDALKLNESNLSRFLQTFVGHGLQGFARTGRPKITPFPESGQLLATQIYAHPDGRRVLVSLDAAATPQGPKITSAFASLTLDMLAASLPSGQSVPDGRARTAFWGKALRDALPVLSSTGISGLVRQGNSGRDEYYSFAQFADRCERQGRGETVFDRGEG